MKNSRNLILIIGEWIQTRKESQPSNSIHRIRSRWLPNPGNIIFTLLVVAVAIATQSVWADTLLNSSTPGPNATTINYQGRLADSGGTPSTGNHNMTFALYDAETGGNIVWGPEAHAAVPVNDGLFNVGLGSQTVGGIPTNAWDGDRYLEITINGETLDPREPIRSVPVAGMALTVPSKSINSSHLSLDSAQSCLTTNAQISLPGGYTSVPIPSLDLSLTLDEPSKVLIWIDGLARFYTTGFTISYVEMLVDGESVIGNYSNLDETWDNIKGQRIISLDSGTHQLTVEGRAKSIGDMEMHGYSPWQTCIYYLVLGE